MNRYLAAIVLLACTLSVVEAQDGATIRVRGRTSTLSYDTHGKSYLPIIDVRLNERIVRSFAVDTGSPVSVLRSSVATELKLDDLPIPAYTAARLRTIPGEAALRYVKMESMIMGSIRVENCPLVILSDGVMDRIPGQIDGIVGMGLLRNSVIDLDPVGEWITFHFPGTLTGEVISQHGFSPESSTEIVDGDHDLKYTVTASFPGGRKEEMLIDTGADSTSISAKLASEMKLVSASKKKVGTLYGDIWLSKSTVSSLTAGNTVFEGVEVSYPLTSDAKSRPILGGDLLSRCRVLIDFPAGKMYLAK